MYVALEKRIGLKGENARLRANPLSFEHSEDLCHQERSKQNLRVVVFGSERTLWFSRQSRSSPCSFLHFQRFVSSNPDLDLTHFSVLPSMKEPWRKTRFRKK